MSTKVIAGSDPSAFEASWTGFGKTNALSGLRTGVGVWALLGTRHDVTAAEAAGPTFSAALVAVCSVDTSAIYARSLGTGVSAESDTWIAVYGKSQSTSGGPGIMGEAVGPGVVGKSQTWHGVYGETQSTTGGAAVCGDHTGDGIGVKGMSKSGIGLWGEGPRAAGWFNGNVHVTGQIDAGGDITCANGSDCAEYFDVAGQAAVDAGTVMILGEDGMLLESQREYDKRVAGVVSGAGSYRPGILLDRRPVRQERKAIALAGKVFCKVDAAYGSIQAGDLLTTSPTPGHAMKVQDAHLAFGAVLGKSLRPLSAGTGLLPILVALQ